MHNGRRIFTDRSIIYVMFLRKQDGCDLQPALIIEWDETEPGGRMVTRFTHDYR